MLKATRHSIYTTIEKPTSQKSVMWKWIQTVEDKEGFWSWSVWWKACVWISTCAWSLCCIERTDVDWRWWEEFCSCVCVCVCNCFSNKAKSSGLSHCRPDSTYINRMIPILFYKTLTISSGTKKPKRHDEDGQGLKHTLLSQVSQL